MEPDELTEGTIVYWQGMEATVTRGYDGYNVKIDPDDHEEIRVNPDHVTSGADQPTSAIDGVGAGRAEKLDGVGISTVGDLAAATVDEITEAGIDEGHAESIHDTAVSFLD